MTALDSASVGIGVAALVMLAAATWRQWTDKRHHNERRRVQDALWAADSPMVTRAISEAANVPTKRLMPILHKLVHDGDVVTDWVPFVGGIQRRAYLWQHVR